jgi:predicted ATPase with chaperone activity
VLRVARTIADLEGCERVRSGHVAQAIALRGDASLSGNRVA